MDRKTILDRLTCPDASCLFQDASAVRASVHGDGVLVRGLLEISSHCVANCLYCGLRRGNGSLPRFRMTPQEIVETSLSAARSGIGTVVLQSGEDPEVGPEVIASIVAEIRAQSGVAITLSLGELPPEAYSLWRAAGADRYLLKFETSNAELYQRMRPGRVLRDRLACLKSLDALGYQVGSGNMVGLPMQTLGDLADDLLLMAELELDMIGIGPFLAHPHTPLAGADEPVSTGRNEHTPSRACDLVDLTQRCVAIARLLLPNAHLPATTALGTIVQGGRQRALQVGANVLMQDITPSRYQQLYDIYPNRVRHGQPVDQCGPSVQESIQCMGRFLQSGRGDALG
jgi:biotin synthase